MVFGGPAVGGGVKVKRKYEIKKKGKKNLAKIDPIGCGEGLIEFEVFKWPLKRKLLYKNIFLFF